MDVEKFFEKVNEQNWRSNIKNEATHKFNSLIEAIQEKKDEIIDEVVESISEMESLKIEEKEEFTYSSFQKWLDHFTKDIIEQKLEEE
jgi:hypothetical protein